MFFFLRSTGWLSMYSFLSINIYWLCDSLRFSYDQIVLRWKNKIFIYIHIMCFIGRMLFSFVELNCTLMRAKDFPFPTFFSQSNSTSGNKHYKNFLGALKKLQILVIGSMSVFLSNWFVHSRSLPFWGRNRLIFI